MIVSLLRGGFICLSFFLYINQALKELAFPPKPIEGMTGQEQKVFGAALEIESLHSLI